MKTVSLVGPFGHWAIKSGCALVWGGFALCLSCGVSHAGEWEITAGSKGTSLSQKLGQRSSGDWSGTYSLVRASGGKVGDSLLAQSDATPLIKLRWLSDTHETPPDFVNVLVGTTATALGIHTQGGETTFTLTVSPGKVADFPAAADVSNSYQRKIATYRKLIKVSTKDATREADGSYVISCGFQVTAKGSATIAGDPAGGFDRRFGGYPSDNPELISEIDVDARKDSRSVKLSRNDKDKFVVENGNWTTYGKTCYSYGVTSPNSGPGEFHNSVQPFAANIEGNWSSIGTAARITWNWTSGTPLYPGVTADSKYYSHRIAPVGGLSRYSYRDSQFTAKEKWTGTGIASQTATITYDATDQGDGANATAKYVLEVHEPIEIAKDFNYPVWAYCPIWGSGPLPDDPNAVMQPNGIIEPDGQNNPSVTVGHGESKGMTYVVGGEFGAHDVGAALGLFAEWTHETSTSVERSQSVNIYVPKDNFTYPLFENKYIRHRVSYRHFTDEGEHELASVEAPPGSGLYDTPLHEFVKDESSQGGSTIVWAPPQPLLGGRVPAFTTTPAEPTPFKSGHYS